MATYTDNYNLKMPSGQDAPDVEDFNGNAEIIDKALGAHANNFADKYDPGSTYTQGKLCIQNDALWKAKQNIDAPEPWTESHWESTTLAAELSSLNSSPEVINITPISGSNYSGYGNCYYYKKGSRVHIHIGIQGLTGGVNTTISILPSGYRPSSLISAIGFGTGWSEKAVLLITQNGELNVQSEGSYAMIDVEYDAFS